MAAPIAVLCVCALAVGGIAYAWNATSNTENADIPVDYQYVVLSVDVTGSSDIALPLSTVYTADDPSTTEVNEESTAYKLSDEVDSLVATVTVTIDDDNGVTLTDITSVVLNVTGSNSFFTYKYKVGTGSETAFTSGTDFTVSVNGETGISFDDSHSLTVQIYACAAKDTSVTSVTSGSVSISAYAKAGTF